MVCGDTFEAIEKRLKVFSSVTLEAAGMSMPMPGQQRGWLSASHTNSALSSQGPSCVCASLQRLDLPLHSPLQGAKHYLGALQWCQLRITFLFLFLIECDVKFYAVIKAPASGASR